MLKRETGESRFLFADIFAGIGGMRRAFESCGGACAFSCEKDVFATTTYSANYDTLGEVFAPDAIGVDARDIPDIDILLAGFPCQPFSAAGVSKRNSMGRQHGFLCETQGTLFYDVARFLRDKRPTAFLLENVKNLVSHDKGRTFATMMDVLVGELGYRVSWKVLNAAGLVPQRRERIFVVGFDADEPLDFAEIDVPDPANGPIMDAILHPVDGGGVVDRYTDDEGRAAAKYDLSDRQWRYLREYKAKHESKGNGFGYGLVGGNDVARTLTARYYKDGSEILVDREGRNPRRLTPRECSRLMGFDSPTGSDFVIPVSDTQAYRQFGNSVVVPLVERIAESMVGKMANA